MQAKTIRGIEVPAVGLGTFELVGKDAVKIIGEAVELGYRHIDTAAKYGNEGDIGEGLRVSGIPREELFLTTKVWITDCTPDAILGHVDESLKKLQVDQVNLLLLHWPSPYIPLSDTIRALMKSLDAGQTRAVGVSNFPPTLLTEAMAYGDIFCNQVEFHPYLSQNPLLDMAASADLLVTAYAPLAIGRVSTDPTLVEIAKAHGKEPAQIALRWLIDHSPVAVIPKTRSSTRLRQNIDLFDFSLSPAETAAIDSLACGHRIYDEEWVADWEDNSRANGPALRTVTLAPQ